ncbi:MAG: LacI family transcriptional regulator [Roseburia sp.]|nr:LacI family transcriptional regulator [Anaeroplasma bactoclasticum]MCM1195980.1 LacI family transcriptional regulator [Roseburia sp.]MCM1556408.1 LacI family transcriptional regulator [Anaeroplasma bactoclasticum]
MKIKDIAKELHLSISTVSKALNGAFDVSKETKQAVIAYAKAHGYKSRDERLTVKTIRRLCFIYDNITAQSNIIMPLGLSFSTYARKNNFEVIQVDIKSITTSYNDFMKQNNFDGAFIAGLNYKSPLLTELKSTVYPTVLYDNIIVADMVATIHNENINTIASLVELLKENNHTRIGFIHGDKNSFVSNERFAGYIIGQTMNDIDYNPKYVYYGDFTEASGIEAAKYFTHTDVTAIICASDVMAIGLIHGLEAEGKRVPLDISVTGYDDLDVAKYVKPSLTTVKQDLDLIGEKAFTLLTSILMNRSSQRLVISGEIKVRDSIAKHQETL